MGSGRALRPPPAAAKLDLSAPVSSREHISSSFLLDVVGERKLNGRFFGQTLRLCLL